MQRPFPCWPPPDRRRSAAHRSVPDLRRGQARNLVLGDDIRYRHADRILIRRTHIRFGAHHPSDGIRRYYTGRQNRAAPHSLHRTSSSDRSRNKSDSPEYTPAPMGIMTGDDKALGRCSAFIHIQDDQFCEFDTLVESHISHGMQRTGNRKTLQSLHPAKAAAPRERSSLPAFTRVRPVQPRKAELSMYCTVSGITTLFSRSLPLKAEKPILFTGTPLT